ncbi:MAG: penicillin-binding protein [Chloroflexi bacterium]|nr:MAG: penicillin-binding protein [Chloroflexota bacterium]
MAGAVGHQYRLSRDSRLFSEPARDGRGRRLRASAHGTGPRFTRGSGFGIEAPRDLSAWVPPVAKLTLVFVLAAGAFLASSQAYIDFAANLPDAHAIAATPLQEDTLIFASDGKTMLADVHPEGVQHYYEPLSSMGHWLPDASVAIEDANFWHEPGIDPMAMARAAWVDWREHRTAQGASTITQQLVKLRLLDSSPTYERKLKEAYLAIQVERSYSKPQILEMYLNTVHYGNNSQGTLAASRIYFHKETKDLDLAQAAMLAGIPQSPLYNSPFNNWGQAKARQQSVLDAMVRARMIDRPLADQAFAEDLSPRNGKMFGPGPQVLAATGFAYWVMDQISAKYGVKVLQGGGLRVVTTLNTTLQGIAEKAMINQLNDQRWRHVSQGALTAIDPHTGAVVAMVGAADPGGPDNNNNFAVWPPRNPGSSFKIYNYTAAIASGKFTMVTPIVDSPITITNQNPPWQPKNYDMKYHGTCQLQQCMGNSLNVPAVKVELGNGVDKVAQIARDMGAPPWIPQPNGKFTSDDPLNAFGPSLTLGGYGETTLQMATGASVLGAQGVLHPPFAINKITASDGTAIFTADPGPQAKQVLDPKVAFIMEQIMSDDDNRAMIFGRGSPLTLPGRRVGAKTGTTDDFKDAWTVGYTPDLAAAVWFGNPDWSAMVQGSDGVFVAAPGWHNFMEGALNAMGANPATWFGEPAGLQHFSVSGKTAWFLPGTSPSTPAPPLPSWASTSSAPAPKPSGSPTPGPTPPPKHG